MRLPSISESKLICLTFLEREIVKLRTGLGHMWAMWAAWRNA